jgi:FkbM family methyltransferase
LTQLYRIARDFQSRFGFLLDAKADAQRLWRKARRQPFEAEFALLRHIDISDRSILDIGANRGQSIDAIRLYQASAKVIAFEPNTLLAKKLVARFRRDPNVHIMNAGLSASDVEADLYVPYYRRFMYDGLASFDESEARGWLNAETVWNFDAAKLRVEKCTCKLKRLDPLQLTPKVVKIDVQGFEADVLKGGEQTFNTVRPLIILENNPDADTLLKSWHWQAFVYVGGHLVPGARGVNNTVYIHAESREFEQLKGA